ncbi:MULTISPECIES: helix-turn-helix transcriptional regulator [Variovorax]|jgi:DNA-binding CsgD family transcriptional regulator|uniref:helix-turn-helix transcriptional regulator n=1 Tax=Variovorax TaxID=34072 RepID=UPI00086BEC6E|nr:MULTISPECIES: helix-turn-helix transcriptional regulator [Variovorax]MBN8757330.1 helix-turn-helix transcriptional regulator [Variovorax sp.]ODU17955.1 MAG: helix-turn-helix transcriptional regulator [Variovorax sp. SCN 67-85]ODV24490.1 MAG: helix-turn-helix transcriptional regulator [Variovorax sp. SCN 67-20]OJZ13569.1 MAG: helix-turn-helix transcriptional regulator [Variovorax sp. 67-131]UKI06220.1 helix-turn-helix transcriptional regulator [Variovorax paradoxus]
MTHLTRNDCAIALRLLEQLESWGSPVRHHGSRDGSGSRAVRRIAAKAPGWREFRRAELQADYYRRVGLEHAVAVAFLYRLACRADAPLPDAPPAALTPREGDVMHWLSRGKTDAEIAALLEISPRTVHKHLEHVYVKLGVETRTAAVMRALAMGGAP